MTLQTHRPNLSAEQQRRQDKADTIFCGIIFFIVLGTGLAISLLALHFAALGV